MTSKDLTAPDDEHCVSAEFAEVLRGCCAGDRVAQRQLYELQQDSVHQLAARMVGREEAPDLVQQIFLQLFRKVGQFEGHSKFETWLYRLAMNEALQHLRKKKRWRFSSLISEPASSYRSKTEGFEDREMLEAALARLEPELRAVFILKELEELSYRDIAASVGIPEGTVGSRLNRARRELQRHLADLGWEA